MNDTLKQDITGVAIESVSTRSVTVNGAPKTAWDVKTVGGPKLSTLDAALGNAAMQIQAQGAFADMNVTVKQNGNYTNYYLNTIRLSAGSAETAAGAAALGAQVAQESKPVSFDQFSSGEKAKQTSIHRQVAAKVAASILGATDGPADFWANTEAVYHFFETGVVPGGAKAAAAAQSNMSLPAFTGVEQPPPLDDDIPF